MNYCSISPRRRICGLLIVHKCSSESEKEGNGGGRKTVEFEIVVDFMVGSPGVTSALKNR